MNRQSKRGASLIAGVAAFGLIAGFATVAKAAPLSPDLQKQLMAIYDRWSGALTAGKLADAAAVSASELRKQIAEAMKSRDDAEGLTEMAREMRPDKIDIEHGSIAQDGAHATIMVLASKTIPANAQMPPDGPKPGSTVHSEITLKFVLEGGAWRFVEQDFGADPAQAKACRDQDNEKLAEYNQGRTENSGGAIRRVEFKPDHTLVVFRVLDEDNCAILPPKDQIAKGGADPNALVPFAVIEVDGYPHRSDKQRVWARSFKVLPE